MDKLTEKNKVWWYKMDTARFNEEVGGLSAEAVGCFILIRNHIFKREFVEYDEAKVLCRGAKQSSIKAALSRMDTKEMEGRQVWHSGYLESLRFSAEVTSRVRSEAGREGAKKRWAQRANVPV